MTEIIGNRQDRILVIGAGLAGLIVALRLAPQPVILLSKAPLGRGAASAWAQGGIAAAIGEGDSPQHHADDTLAAGEGLCDPDIVHDITHAAPAAIADLQKRGVRFDCTHSRDLAGDGPQLRPMALGALALGREAAHSRRRIVHAGGDGSGAELMRALIAAIHQTPSITVMEGFDLRRLFVREGRIAGIQAMGLSGPVTFPAHRVVLATGGLGGVFRHSTNPKGALGSGLAVAARAGAVLRDMAFIQFHPTALDVGGDPLPLLSEALRGEGAVLIDETGARFLTEDGAELAPRDVLARAVARHLDRGHRVFLDTRPALGARIVDRFPTLTRLCRQGGIDPVCDPIPVRPAAHYAMGGIRVDRWGRSSLPGLWACGEVASTGLHGANRLASNSLLEGVVCAGWVADNLAATSGRPPRPITASPLPPRPDADPVRPLLSKHLGLLRDAAGLAQAIKALLPMATSGAPPADPALVGLMMAVAAYRAEESRGAHARLDFPRPASLPGLRCLSFDQALDLAQGLSGRAAKMAQLDRVGA